MQGISRQEISGCKHRCTYLPNILICAAVTSVGVAAPVYGFVAMITLNIYKYIAYCAGFGYLDKRRFADDMAHNRAVNRETQSRLDQLLYTMQRLATEPVLPQNQFQNPVLRTIQNFTHDMLQRFVYIPLQRVMGFTVPVAQNIAAAVNGVAVRTLGFLDRAMGQILSFFYGFKKDRQEEQDRRDKDEFPDSDYFTRRVVESTMGGGQGSSHR